MSGRGWAASPFVNSFTYFSLRGNFLQWYSHPDNSERKERGKRYYCFAPLTQSRPCWTARHLVITVSLFIFDSITLTVPSHLYRWWKTHTHLLLDWIKYDITKAQPAIFSKEGCTHVSLKIFFAERSQAARLHSLKSLPSRPLLVGHYFLYNNGNVYEEFGTRSGRRGCRVVWAWAKYINLPLVIFAWIILMLSW